MSERERERERERQRQRDRDRDRETERQRDRDRDRQRQTDRQADRQTENSNSKTLFYKDCSLGSVKNLSKLVLAKLLINRYQITGITYKHNIAMNEGDRDRDRDRENGHDPKPGFTKTGQGSLKRSSLKMTPSHDML